MISSSRDNLTSNHILLLRLRLKWLAYWDTYFEHTYFFFSVSVCLILEALLSTEQENPTGRDRHIRPFSEFHQLKNLASFVSDILLRFRLERLAYWHTYFKHTYFFCLFVCLNLQIKITFGVTVWSLLSQTAYSPYTDAWRRVLRDAVCRSDNPSWMHQSASTERETRRSPDHCLPRPGTSRGLGTTNNSRAGFVSTFSWSTVTTTSTATAAIAAVTATATATAAAVVTSFLTVLLHVVYPMFHLAVT